MSVSLHTTLGTLKLELFIESAPKACENFLALCASNYYVGCIFHRSIKGFITQTGDPSNSGKGGESIWKQKFNDEICTHLKHNAAGIVSMANSGPDSNNSQFFITFAKQPQFDGKYTIFARVIDGVQDTLKKIEQAAVDEKTFRPLEDIKIEKITIHANPIADAQYNVK